MINIYLIRHAESVNNLHYHHTVGGRSNHTPLTATGILQAKQLGNWLKQKNFSFDEIHASTAIRASETAKLACDAAGISLDNIIYSDNILELHQGDWQGRLRAEVYNPEMREIINQDPLNFKAPNGESQKEVEERMLEYICSKIINSKKEFTTNGKDYNAAIFTHGMAIKCTFRGILNSNPIMTHKIVMDNTSITKLSYEFDGWHLHYANKTNHLL